MTDTITDCGCICHTDVSYGHSGLGTCKCGSNFKLSAPAAPVVVEAPVKTKRHVVHDRAEMAAAREASIQHCRELNPNGPYHVPGAQFGGVPRCIDSHLPCVCPCPHDVKTSHDDLFNVMKMSFRCHCYAYFSHEDQLAEDQEHGSFTDVGGFANPRGG